MEKEHQHHNHAESEHPIAQGLVRSSEAKYQLKEFNSIQDNRYC